MDALETAVVIVGGGVAGRAAGLFTARNGLETIVLDDGSSLLRRNAHLENYPGLPGGINARVLLERMTEQAVDAGCQFETATVETLERTADGFLATTAADDRYQAETAILATKNEVGYLDSMPDVEIVDRGKSYVATDNRGRTALDGLYAAGRLAGKPHQTIVAAGHGSEVAITLLEDRAEPFYHDWVAPAGYFTGRGRDVPPGCEEIDEPERLDREREGRKRRERLLDAHSSPPPEQHPSVDQ